MVEVITYTKEQAAKDRKERNAWFLKVNGREFTFDDFLKSIGGRNCGESQDTGRRGNSGSQDEGIENQT